MPTSLDASHHDPSAGVRGMTLAMLALMGLGLVMVASATGLEDELLGRPLASVRGHLMRVGVAVAVFLACSRVRPQQLYRAAPLLFGLSVLLLGATLAGGLSVNNSSRWLALGPFAFQPSELGRVAVVVSLGAWVARVREGMSSLVQGVLVPFAIMGLPAVLVLLEPDYGSSVYLLFMGAMLLWIAGAPGRYLAACFGSVMAVVLGYSLLNFKHVWRRLEGFTSPETGSQVWQGLVAVGSGGATGTGLGAGRAQWGYVPEAQNDFILTVIGEELGLVGVLLLLCLYGSLLYHGTRLLLGVRSRFGLVVGAGLLFQIAVQALMNIAVVTAMAPPKGLPLPFVSMGGTSLLVLAASCGLLLGLVRHPEQDPGSTASAVADQGR
ncbi:MAG: stage V sporulation protein E [Planctomycetota bacterium]|nr:MAG: stage V sporulation protein E [Planctomycetota bacterium]